MRLSDYLAIGVIIVLTYLFINSSLNPIIETKIEYIKGDTVKTIINQKVFDEMEYSFKTQIDSIRKTKAKWSANTTVHDTVTLTDTFYISYWSLFDLGDSTLGTSGKVSFDMKDFKFSDIKYRFPETIKTVVDTMKLTETIERPFFLNQWFYTSVALLVALAALIGT